MERTRNLLWENGRRGRSYNDGDGTRGAERTVEDGRGNVKKVTVNPRTDYQSRLEVSRADERTQTRRERIVGRLRVAVFVPIAAVILVLFEKEKPLTLGAIAGTLAACFLVLLYLHQRVLRALTRARWTSGYFQRGLDRLDDQWAGHGSQGGRFLDAAHPYAADLDLFGPGSLFERMCAARTGPGEETLAAWLLAPAAPDDIRERQAAVAELRERLDLRVDLGVLGGPLTRGVDFGPLLTWAAAPAQLTSLTLRIGVALLALVAAVTVTAWFAGEVSIYAVAGVVLVESGVAFALRRRVKKIVDPVERRGRDLLLLNGVLARLERERFEAPLLSRLVAGLLTEGVRPSDRLAQLASRVEWLDSRKNGFFAPIAALLLWTTQCAFALEAWRRKAGAGLPRWLAAVANLEALISLATYSYENPSDPFPEIIGDGPRFDGDGLGHPLLPAANCVANDVHLGAPVRLLVISGSNMSGKSTLLRTVGINAVLAQAGAPVRAGRLRLSPLAVGATLRIQDSLQAGRSRFYAEIVRVRQLVDLTHGRLPLLFLLDELFQGTNSNDRRQGAEGVVKSLVAAGAIGLITTHDLALTAIADQLGPQAANVHFADQFEDGAMSFDYKMRPGVVQKSNALALMRAVGLDV
jgi:hypothetical protein